MDGGAWSRFGHLSINQSRVLLLFLRKVVNILFGRECSGPAFDILGCMYRLLRA
jgi:hypothetical protein